MKKKMESVVAERDDLDSRSPFDCEGRSKSVFATRKRASNAHRVSCCRGDVHRNRALNDSLAIERSFATTRSEDARAVGFLGRFIDRPVFGKLFWRRRIGRNAAERQNVEVSLLQQDLERLVSRGETPCLPLRLFSVTTTVGRFRKTRLHRHVDARLRGMRIVDACERDEAFSDACLAFLSRRGCGPGAGDARRNIENESHGKLLAAARSGRLFHEKLDVDAPTLCRAGLVDVVLTEKCGEETLNDHLASRLSSSSSSSSSCLAETYLMLVHALSVFARHAVSHNDLHSRNVVIRRVPPTVVSFGRNRRFVTTVAPFVVDWDLGRSDAVKNPELEDYWFVGLSDRANPLFDLYGLVKTFLYHHEAFCRWSAIGGTRGIGGTVGSSVEASRLATAFRELFEPAKARHGWLLEYEYRYRDDASQRTKTQRCVQQTPYIPNRGSGKVEKRWPSSVRELTPSFSAIGDRLYALVERPLGPNDPIPEDATTEREFFFPDFFDLDS